MSTPYEQAVEAAAEAVRPFMPSTNWSYSAVADQAGEAAVSGALLPLFAPLEALADEWDAGADAYQDVYPTEAHGARLSAQQLRAVLASIKGRA